MNYEISVEHDVKPSEEDQAVDVRVYAPENSSKYTVYTYRDGAWEKVSTSRDGSYLVFNSPDRDVTFAVTKALPSRSEPIPLPGWKNAGQTGLARPASLPSSQLSKRR